MSHYGSAVTCVAGLGYGFAQPSSTSVVMKTAYFGSLALLVASIRILKAAGKWEDDSDPHTFWQRCLFCASEYAVFLSGCLAVGRPRVIGI